MKPRKPTPFRLNHSMHAIGAALVLSHFATPSASALTYYWDQNSTLAGFGTAGGTWNTSGSSTWNQTADGTTGPIVSTTTTTSDVINFGNGATGLAGGTITVGTVSAGNMTFASGSGAIVLSGGTITNSAAKTITVDNTTNTIGSIMAGAATSLTVAGSGTLALTNTASTYTGQTIIGNNTAGTLKLQVTKLANLSTASSLGAPTTIANGVIQIGVTSNPSTLELVGGTSASSTDRRVQIGSSANGSGGATILNNNTNAAHTLTFSNATFNQAATGVTSSSRNLTLGGSNTGNNTITGAIVPNTGGAGTTGLIKSGTGTWILNGVNTYTGTTRIDDGILVIGGRNTSAGATTVNGGTLQLNNATNGGLASGTLNLTAGTLEALTATRSLTNNTNLTTITISGSQSLTFTAGTLTGVAGGDRTLTNNLTSGKLLTLNNVVLNNGAVQRQLAISGSGDTIITGSITSGNGFVSNSFLKGGAGTMTLQGNNSYGGNTTVSGGTLKLSNNATGLGFGGLQTTATGTTTVNSGFTLDLNGASGINEPIILSGTGIGGDGALINSGADATIGSGLAGLTIGGASTGSGYSTAPAVTISGTGSGATATATLGLTAASFGAPTPSGTITSATVAITGGGGTGATATVNNLGVITIVNPGTGYTSAPTITATVVGGGTITYGASNATNFTVSGVRMTAAGSGYTGTPTYTFDSGNATAGGATLSSVTLAADSSIGGSGNTTINAVVSQSGGARSLTKVGAGTLTLAGANTYSGGTTIANNGGILRITNAGALGSGGVTISTAGTNTGTLELALTGTNNITNTFNGFNSANGLTGSPAGNAQILNTSGTNTISSNLTVTGTGGSGLNVVSNGGLLTLSGTITHTIAGSGRTLSLGGSGDGVVSGAISNNITGDILTLNKSGAGTWTLSNASNAYTGVTTVSAGTLKFGNNNVIADTSAVVLGSATTSGTLDIAGFSDTLGTSAVATMLTLGINSTTVGGLQNQVINSGGSAVLAVDGGITYNAGAVGFNNGKALISANLQLGVTTGVARNFTVADSTATAVDLEITGVLSSGTSNGITKEGTGTLFLNNDNNTATGQFIVNNGKVQVTKLADAGSNSSLGTGSVNSVIRLGDTQNPTLEYVGATDSSTNRRILLGTTGGSGTGATILNNGAGKLTFSNTGGFNNTNDATIARTLTLGGANTLDNTITGAIIDNAGVGGTVGVTKQDAGIWILDGTNTYSGATTVNGGTLVVNGSISTGNVTVSGTGSTLKGSGTIEGSVTIGNLGTLATGTSIESLASGALSFTTGSNFQYELDKDAAATAAGDLTAVTGNLSLAGTVNLSFIETGSGSWELGTPLGDHFGSPAADKLTLISYTGTWNGGLFTYLGNTVLDDSGITINGQQWWFNYNDTDAGSNFNGDLGAATRFVTITVPEPRAALLGGLGLLALLRRRR